MFVSLRHYNNANQLKKLTQNVKLLKINKIVAISEYSANLRDEGLWYLHRIGLLRAAVGCITELSLAEYGKVIIFIRVLKSLNTCSKSKTENNNLEPSLTHTFLGFSHSFPFPLSSVEFTGNRSLMFSTLCWDTSRIITPIEKSLCKLLLSSSFYLKRSCGLDYVTKLGECLPKFQTPLSTV